MDYISQIIEDAKAEAKEIQGHGSFRDKVRNFILDFVESDLDAQLALTQFNRKAR